MSRPRVILREEHGLTRFFEPVQIGVPLPQGDLSPEASFCLRSSEGKLVEPFQSRPLSYWPDGSVRWMYIAFPANLGPGETSEVELVNEEPHYNNPSSSVAPKLHSEGGSLSTKIELPNGEFRELKFELRDDSNSLCSLQIETSWTLIENGSYFSSYRTEGSFVTKAGARHIRFVIELQLFKVGELIRVDARLHNPRRAIHKGGLWDLGDPGSVLFTSFSLTARQSEIQSYWITSHHSSKPVFSHDKSLRLHQESSGGENWHSQNHVNADGRPTTQYRGFRLYRGSTMLALGNRASPVAGLLRENSGTCAMLSNFWQNFPSSLEVSKEGLCIGFFPATGLNYELQGGEQKQQTAWIQLNSDGDTLRNLQFPVTAVVPAQQYESSRVFSCFACPDEPNNVDDLVALSLDTDRGLLQKRELIDEYGWRNFGDIYADHECLYLSSDEPRFITHYNNQYDAIYGFARQYALTGDRRWFELMDDLARHVTDIDIYHTDDDRIEYNHGLFWHTDHYLDAHTSTHRTYSRLNATSSVPGQTGGGPGSEHCYGTGLLYHFWMTGSSSSREAVLELATWMTNLHTGSSGLLAQLLAIKKNDLHRLKEVISGNINGVYRYPFTRGTGNFINILLDASLIEPKGRWLVLAEQVIRSTVGPNDNIEKRKLLNAETGWHYLVLLSAITRYLWLKLENDAVDEHYWYAMTSLRHYWRWMVEYERPFMRASEDLEYPNHTWVAQDFRKVVLLKQAAFFDPKNREAFEKKASEWLTYVTETLSTSEERFLTRVQIILLQNYGPHRYEVSLPEKATVQYASTRRTPNASTTINTLKVIYHILERVTKGLMQFRPSREKAWLKMRLES